MPRFAIPACIALATFAGSDPLLNAQPFDIPIAPMAAIATGGAEVEARHTLAGVPSRPATRAPEASARTPASQEAAAASGRELPFSDGGWDLKGSRATIARDEGRDVFQVESGFAYRRDVRLQDGTIDLDVKVTTRRSFVYLMFRMAEDDEHEEVYLRPHKSGLPDAVQYAPVWQGRSGWQLYHGPGGTAAIPFEPHRWTHVRLVLQGRRGALFVGDMSRPALLMPLARDPRPGYLALRGFLPANVAGEGPIATFANVRIRSDEVAYDFAAAQPPGRSTVAGAVRAWSVSPSFVPKDADVPTLPAVDAFGPPQRFDTEADGLLELHRHVRIPEGASRIAAVARVAVRAQQAGTYALDLGFSDIATVFLNGRVIFRGEASYSYDGPRREGLIGYDQARLYLPLLAGSNDLAIVVSDGFGGWGLMARFPSMDGLLVTAPAGAAPRSQ
jgi:hypothetical protein